MRPDRGHLRGLVWPALALSLAPVALFVFLVAGESRAAEDSHLASVIFHLLYFGVILGLPMLAGCAVLALVIAACRAAVERAPSARAVRFGCTVSFATLYGAGLDWLLSNLTLTLWKNALVVTVVALGGAVVFGQAIQETGADVGRNA